MENNTNMYETIFPVDQQLLQYEVRQKLSVLDLQEAVRHFQGIQAAHEQPKHGAVSGQLRAIMAQI